MRGDPAFQHQIRRIYALGERATFEFVCDLAALAACPTMAADLAGQYLRLNPSILKALDLEQIPAAPLHLVRGGEWSAPKVICQKFTPSVQNTRAGFADLAFPDAGIAIKNAVLHSTPARRWIAWPAVPADRGSWQACMTFMATTDRRGFQDACVAAIDQFVADALDSGPPLLMP
jgi:hypothetical protein